MKNIVISAVNFFGGGALSVLKDCLVYLSNELTDSYAVITLVHKRDLFNIPNITYYEFPDSRKSWLRRLYYEYIYFKKLSRQIRPYLWLSLHDMTPNVDCEIQAVYCHNPSPFYKIRFKEIYLQPKFAMFNFLYKYLYGINIHKNDYVIVQQSWMRDAFRTMYNLKQGKIIVSHPKVETKDINESIENIADDTEQGVYKFFYPALPHVYKNFEVIGDAAEILNSQDINNFVVYITIDGSENRYASYIWKKYGRIKSLKFIGRVDREIVFRYYAKADCLIYPSRLETWGIPITEFKNYNKPILLADEKYAYEAIGDYGKVKFFNSRKPSELAGLMKSAMKKNIVFEITKREDMALPFASGWGELFNILLDTKN